MDLKFLLINNRTSYDCRGRDHIYLQTLSTSSNSTVDALPSSTSSSAETTPTRQRSSPVLSSTPIIPAGSSSSTNSSNSSSSSSSSKSNDAKSSKSSKRRPVSAGWERAGGRWVLCNCCSLFPICLLLDRLKMAGNNVVVGVTVSRAYYL